MAKIYIRGDIIGNDDKWIYDWLEWESTCPRDVRGVLDTVDPLSGEGVDVYISSPGGMVVAGAEIYSMLSEREDVRIHIDGLAASAASVIAMAGRSSISPVGMLMVHRCSSFAMGNAEEIQKTVNALSEIDRSIATAYCQKSGMTMKDALKMMSAETWLTSGRCLELGLVDEVTEPKSTALDAAASFEGLRLTDEIRSRVLKEKAERDRKDKEAAERKAEAEALTSDLYKFGV